VETLEAISSLLPNDKDEDEDVDEPPSVTDGKSTRERLDNLPDDAIMKKGTTSTD